MSRINVKKPGPLSNFERKIFRDKVEEFDSDYRVKVGTVSTVVGLAANPGAIVLSEADGLLYACDDTGWVQAGVTSPIRLFVEYTDTQFAFKFKAPATSTLSINDGDGTVTNVAGQDDTTVTHTTNYSEAGTYYFYVEGDVLTLTHIDIYNQAFVSGDVSGWSALTSLTYLNCYNTSVSGDVSGWSALTSLDRVHFANTSVSGDVSGWSALTSLTYLNCYNTSISGDVSGWSALINLTSLHCYSTFVGFNNITSWSMTGTINLYSLNTSGATSKMVDDMLESFVGLTACLINIAGNNAARTSASDAAMITLVDNGNTVTVNENLGPESLDNGNFSNWTGDNPDDWSVRTEDANNYITEVSGQARMVTDGDFMYMYQLKLTIGKYYITTVEITESALGSVLIGDLSVPANQKSITGVGVHEFRFIAEGAAYGISQDGACDITMAVASLKEVI